jgi:hypothetical protein
MSPAPAGGAVVTDLYAQTNASASGSDTADISVIDDTTGTTLLSCAVNASTVNYCEDSADSVAVAAGDSIKVEITDSGGAVDGALWRVSFRY